MLHRLILSTFSFLTLATCQTNQATSSKKDSQNSTTVVNPKSSTVTTETKTTPPAPQSNEPKMSDGMPPDREAVEIAKKEAAQAAANKAGIIYLKEGENKFLKEYQMNVTFKSMKEDSRCPKDVDCIWAGNATAEIEVMGLATRPMLLQLSTMNDSNKGYAKTQNFNGFNITLVTVSPEITSDKGFNNLKGNYKIGLKFEKGSASKGATTK